MPISVRDKVVVITGGAGEMGSVIARRLVDEGAKVVLADVADGSALADELNETGDAVYVKTDVTSEEATEAMARTAIDAYGRIDALVNNAGLFTAKPWDELTLADWRERFAVNVDGTFLATKAVVPAMTEQGRGKIINIGSDTVWMGTPGFAHYVASKGAVLAFTRAIANELGPRGITRARTRVIMGVIDRGMSARLRGLRPARKHPCPARPAIVRQVPCGTTSVDAGRTEDSPGR
jgi:3-oxoacyl-[acyl-carrier protein] reductase